MEGAGIFTLIGLLIAAPFEIWQARAQRRRFFTPLELNLRRASQPPAIAAIALVIFIRLFGARGIDDAVTALALDPATNWPVAALLGAPIVYGVISFLVGARRCRGMQTDALLATRAFFKLTLGAAVTLYLWRSYPWAVPSAWMVPALALVFLAGVWLHVTGVVRALLLIWPRRTADEMMAVAIAAREINWDPPRRRRWWQFWKR